MTETLEKLQSLVDFLETPEHRETMKAIHNLTLDGGPLVVTNGLLPYAEALGPVVQKYFSDEKKRIRSTIHSRQFNVETGDGEYQRRLKHYSCQFMSVTVSPDRVEAAMKLLGKVLEELLEDDLVLGYLASPSTIVLADETNVPPGILADFQSRGIELKPRTAVFCFLFTKLTTDELRGRYPRWVTTEGDIGKPLEA